MRVVGQYPRTVEVIENEWITLADGCRLAARIWRPADAAADPVPAILEYIPYCTRDGTAARDEAMHPYIAGHGYASIRVDMRGSGESEGLLHDEYLEQEQDDALEVIAWIAAQPWCSGKVGMMGISWGGFNSLQVAARRPPALAAIITSCSTDDRYADDVHYMGGCTLIDNFSWAATMYGRLATPPDPEVVGEGWRESWLNRLENLPLLVETWHAHQRRDDYVRQLVSKMLAYGLGRQLEYYDEMAIRKITTNLEADDYHFQTLIQEVVSSYPFQNRKNRMKEILQ